MKKIKSHKDILDLKGSVIDEVLDYLKTKMGYIEYTIEDIFDEKYDPKKHGYLILVEKGDDITKSNQDHYPENLLEAEFGFIEKIILSNGLSIYDCTKNYNISNEHTMFISYICVEGFCDVELIQRVRDLM
jgi:hypothetical protein